MTQGTASDGATRTGGGKIRSRPRLPFFPGRGQAVNVAIDQFWQPVTIHPQ